MVLVAIWQHWRSHLPSIVFIDADLPIGVGKSSVQP